MIQAKLNELGWEVYRNYNGFADSNIDDRGYSTFSDEYFEQLFSPMPYDEFSNDVITIKQEEK